MEYRIVGTVMPVLEVKLGPGESVVAESGELSWMDEPITMTTTTQKAGAKGLFGALKRSFAGGSLFMTEFTAEQRDGMVAFATKVPGHILPIDIAPGREYLIHRRGYLCGVPTVELNIAFQQSFGAGLFGGAGFILQKVSGSGQAFVELDGEVVEYDLTPGQTLRVHPGHVGMLDANVTFAITQVPGIKNIVFGGDGLFLATLTGPGKVWLQTLPLPNLARALEPYLPQPDNSNTSTGAGLLGGIVGGLISDND